MDDVNVLPTEYKTVKVTEAADKAAIKAAIKSGVTITGCKIEEHKHIQFK